MMENILLRVRTKHAQSVLFGKEQLPLAACTLAWELNEVTVTATKPSVLLEKLMTYIDNLSNVTLNSETSDEMLVLKCKRDYKFWALVP